MATYKQFNILPAESPESSDVISNVKDVVSSGMFANGATSITNNFYTSSTQSGSTAAYYLDVYSANPQTDSTAKPQFSIAYGHINGSGSAGTTGATGNRSSAAIYRQLANTLLGPTETKFVFAGSGNSSGTGLSANDTTASPQYVYALSMARTQLREKMDPGNWEIHLSSSFASIAHGKIKLIDDSGATTDPVVNQGGRVFNIVSGSIATGTAVYGSTAASQPGGAYGLFYPDMGILIFNGAILNTSASLGTTVTSNVDEGNVGRFFNAITGSSTMGAHTKAGLFSPYFAARREEVITSQHYFCRVPNKEFNFSSNPTFATASDGSFTQSTFFKNPKTFITQVGLYNESNELLAVAKLSKPLLKSYSREAIIKVKLDF